MYALLIIVAGLVVVNFYMWASIIKLNGQIRGMKHALLLLIRRVNPPNSTGWSPESIDYNYMISNPDAKDIIKYVADR